MGRNPHDLGLNEEAASSKLSKLQLKKMDAKT